jgi:endonuclease-3 related protein
MGAILTQGTAWSNVEKALERLRGAGLLSYAALRRLDASEIAPLIRPSGYFRVKARRVASFLRFLEREFQGRAEDMAMESSGDLRRKLLSVNGIGPETADAIALYAAGQPLFVVDAYTVRIFGRLGFLSGAEDYHSVQRLFMSALPQDPSLFNDYHAQIVRLGKEFCRPTPRCALCPLRHGCWKRGIRSRAAQPPSLREP